MPRAWTLQELPGPATPGIVSFYDTEWKPYLGITGANHKESPEIIQERADAITIPRRIMITLTPDYLT